jgi:predicted nucleotidyltransferase component of viral defense system
MREIKNIAASVNAQLQNLAKESGKPFQEILQYYVIERFLYRISQTKYCDKFVLKGGLIIYAQSYLLRRPTKDIDFRGYINNSEENLRKIIAEMCGYPVPEDGIIFHAETIHIEETMANADYRGARVTLTATLEKAKIPIQIDINFADMITPKAKTFSFPTLLKEMEMPILLGYPPESIVSEKFHAMIRLVEINSRWKDFYDIWLLCNQIEFQGLVLQEAISTTFRQRQTQIPSSLPVALSDEFATERQKQWQTFLTKNRLHDKEFESFEKVVGMLRAFLMPPVKAIIAQTTYMKSWKAGQGWE